MIDSHCHLDQPPLLDNLKEILIRSKDSGIEKLLTISTTLNSYKKILSIIDLESEIYGTFGIHPHESDKEFLSKEIIINYFSKNKKIIAIGESGLDFFYSHSSREKQLNSFKNHIEAALDLNVPLIVHSRNAENETFNLLNQYKDKNLKVLMHCFTGSSDFAKKLLKINAFFSASGIITFKNTNDLRNTFKQIPSNKLLIETDSPYLAPEPKRGKKNEPSFLKFTLEKLAEIKNTDVDNLDKITTNNFNKLFF